MSGIFRGLASVIGLLEGVRFSRDEHQSIRRLGMLRAPDKTHDKPTGKRAKVKARRKAALKSKRK